VGLYRKIHRSGIRIRRGGSGESRKWQVRWSVPTLEGIENPESYGINKIFSFDDYEFELSDLEIIEKILDLWIGKFSVLQTEIGYVVAEFE